MDIHQMIKSQVMRRRRYAVHTGEKTNVYRGMVKKPEGMRSLRRPMSRKEDDIKINPTEIGWDRIHLAQDMHKWWALVKECTFKFHKMWGIS
jgi:hypothetical protein